MTYQIIITETEFNECLYNTNQWWADNYTNIMRWEHNYIKKKYCIIVKLTKK